MRTTTSISPRWPAAWGRSPAAMRATWVATQLTGRLSGRLGRPAVLRLWFTPWEAPTSARAREREAAWLAGTEPLAIPWQDRTLHGFATGEGPTVLLVHGWTSSAARMGAFVAPLRDAGFRVAAIDLPGHGATGGGGTDAYTMGAALRAVAEELRPTAVVAHSFGSLVLLEALRAGLAVERVALIAPAVRLEHAVAAFQRLYAIPDRAIAGLRSGIEQRFGPDVWVDFEADRAGELLDLPVLIVHDRDDPQVDVADGQLLQAALPQATIEVTDGLGHDRILRDPGVIERVAEFLGAVVALPSAAGSDGG